MSLSELSRDRRLYRSPFLNSSVVGLVPTTVASHLHSLADADPAATPITSCNLSPSHNLALFLDAATATITVWSHQTATATQPLTSPHPSTFANLCYDQNGDTEPFEPHDLEPNLITLAPTSTGAALQTGCSLFMCTTIGYCLYYPSATTPTSSPTTLQLPIPPATVCTAVAYSSASQTFFVGTSTSEIYIVAVRARPLSLRARKLVTAVGALTSLVKGTLGSLFRASPTSEFGENEAVVALFAPNNCYTPNAREAPRDKKRAKTQHEPAALLAVTGAGKLEVWSVDMGGGASEKLERSVDLLGLTATGISIDLQVARIHLVEHEVCCSEFCGGEREFVITIVSVVDNDMRHFYAFAVELLVGYEVDVVSHVKVAERPVGERTGEVKVFVSPRIDVGLVCYLTWCHEIPAKVAGFTLAVGSGQTCQSSRDFVCELDPAVVGKVLGGGTGVVVDGGVRLFTSKGCVVSVEGRFEKAVELGGEEGDGAIGEEQICEVIVGAFEKYEDMSDGQFSSEAVVRSVASLTTVNSTAIDRGCTLASSAILACPSPVHQTASDALHAKLSRHMSFVSFLRHAGIFPRLTLSRCTLAGHGEMINSCKELCDLRNECLAAGEETAASSLTGALMEIQNDVGNVVGRLQALQKRAAAEATSAASDPVLCSSILRNASTAFVVCLGAALKRRGELKEVYETAGDEPVAWNDSKEVRELLFDQLTRIGECGEEFQRKDEDSMLVHNLCIFLLSSYKDGSAMGSPADAIGYEAAKKTSVELLRVFVEDGNETALKVADAHDYWEGVCSITTDGANIGWGEQELTTVIQTRAGSNPLFCGFVLQWLGDHGLHAMALNIGRHCQDVLNMYLGKEGARDLKWINDARSGEFGAAAGSLLGVAEGKTMLMDKKVALSLALIAGEADGGAVWGGDERAAQGLVTVYAQELLMKGEVDDETEAMGDRELCEAAIKALQAVEEEGDLGAGVKLVMIGLAVATRVKKNRVPYSVADKNEDLAESLARGVWEATIKGEEGLWQVLAGKFDSTGDEELKERMRASRFYSALVTYLLNDREFALSGGEKEKERLDNVLGGFKGLERVVGICASLAEEEQEGEGEEGEEGGEGTMLDQ